MDFKLPPAGGVEKHRLVVLRQKGQRDNNNLPLLKTGVKVGTIGTAGIILATTFR